MTRPPVAPVMIVLRTKVLISVIVALFDAVRSLASATGTLSPAARVTISASALTFVSAIYRLSCTDS